MYTETLIINGKPVRIYTFDCPSEALGFVNTFDGESIAIYNEDLDLVTYEVTL